MAAKKGEDKPSEPPKEPLSRLLVHSDAVESAPISKIKQQLEKGNDDEKILALKQTISLLLSGQPAPQLLIPIIRFVMPSKNHTIKKLVLLYLEVRLCSHYHPLFVVPPLLVKPHLRLGRGQVQ